MKPTPEYQKITNDLFVWRGYNPECKVDCWSTAVQTPDGFVFIDPIRLEEQALHRMVGADKVVAVLLTSGNHGRAAAYEMRRLDIPLYAPDGARGDVSADHWVKDGEILFQTLTAVSLPGGGPGETAYLGHGALILGDALLNLDGLSVLPEKYCGNAKLLRESLQALPSLSFHVACFAHGLPLVEGAKEKIAGVVGALPATA